MYARSIIYYTQVQAYSEDQASVSPSWSASLQYRLQGLIYHMLIYKATPNSCMHAGESTLHKTFSRLGFEEPFSRLDAYTLLILLIAVDRCRQLDLLQLQHVLVRRGPVAVTGRYRRAVVTELDLTERRHVLVTRKPQPVSKTQPQLDVGLDTLASNQ